MSYVTINNGKFIFHDDADKSQKLIDIMTPAENQSDLMQMELINAVQGNLPKIFNGTPDGMAQGIIFLRIVSRLLRKPQIHHVLHIGNWSPLDEVLAEMLPQFNPKNFLWSYSPMCPLEKFSNVNFIFDKVIGGGYLLSANKFDTIIFTEPKIPPLEVLIAPKDFGEIYFFAPKSELPDYLKSAQIFDLAENFSLVEVELSPTLKRELNKLTPRGQLDEKINFIRQTIYKLPKVSKKFNQLPPPEKNSCLDEYIAEVARAEKILTEIFPELHSDTLKQNFNMFKEFLIDVRLYDDLQMKKHAVANLNAQVQVLLSDLKNL